MTTNELARIPQAETGVMAHPQEAAQAIVDTYAAWSNVLMRVVNDKGLFTMVGDKKYLQFEAWQLIATFDHAGIDTSDVRPIEDAGEIVGYICHAKVVKDGIVVAAGSGMCGLDSFPTRGKQGFDKHRAAMSAAQTWAGSKAGRMKYSAVAVMGGFGAATAEEMREAVVVDTSEHYCRKHNANWFKKGKMRGYAHPIGDTKEWCNESESEPGEIAHEQRKQAEVVPPNAASQPSQLDLSFARGLEKGKDLWAASYIDSLKAAWGRKDEAGKKAMLKDMAAQLQPEPQGE